MPRKPSPLWEKTYASTGECSVHAPAGEDGLRGAFAQQFAEGGLLYVSCKAVLTDAMTRPFSIQAEGGSRKTVSGKVFLVRDGTRRVVGIMAKEGSQILQAVSRASAHRRKGFRRCSVKWKLSPILCPTISGHRCER